MHDRTTRGGKRPGARGDKSPEEQAHIEEQRAALSNPEETQVDYGAGLFRPTLKNPTPPSPADLLRPLAKTSGRRGKRRELAAMPEPSSTAEYFTTSEAAKYCRFLTQGGIRKAWYDLQVFPCGRRGGLNILTWRRSELDRYMRGEPLKKSEMGDKLMPPKVAAQSLLPLEESAETKDSVTNGDGEEAP